MLLIAERLASGHRLVFVRLLVQHLRTTRRDFRLLVPEDVAQSAEFADNLEHLLRPTEVMRVPNGRWDPHLVTRVAREMRVEEIVIPDGDAYAGQLAKSPWLWGGTPTRVLIIHDPRWERDSEGNLPRQALVKLLALGALERFPMSRVRVKYLAAASVNDPSPAYVNDPVIIERDVDQIRKAAASNRNRLQMGSEVFWVGVVGVISRYKNINLITDAIISASARSSRQIGLALLGPISAEFRDEISTLVRRLEDSGTPVVVDDRLRSNEQVNVDVASVDLVSVIYSVNCTNSTMAKAAALGVRTIAAGPPGFQRLYTETTGRAASNLDPQEIRIAIQQAISEPPPAPLQLARPERFAPQFLS